MKAVSITLPEDLLAQAKALHKNPGEGLNTALDHYIDPTGAIRMDRFVQAAANHIRNPHVSAAPARRTSAYLDTTRIEALREYARRSYLTFDGLLRILIQDFVENQHQ